MVFDFSSLWMHYLKWQKKKVNEQTNGETRRNRAGEKPQNLISSQAASNSWLCLNSNCNNPLKHQTPKRPPPQAPQEQISAHWGRGCRNHDNILPQQSRSTEVKRVCPTHLSLSNEHLPLLCSTQAGNTMFRPRLKYRHLSSSFFSSCFPTTIWVACRKSR